MNDRNSPNDTQIGVLLPARLETRFIEPSVEDEEGRSSDRWQLHIAVIPDDPWMNRHSEVVSQGEAECLKTMWATLEEALTRRGAPVTEDTLRQRLRDLKDDLEGDVEDGLEDDREVGRAAFRLLAQQVGAARAWWLATHFSPFEPPTTGQKALSRMDALPEQIEIWLGLRQDGDQEGDVELQRLEPPLLVNKAELVFQGDHGAALHLFDDDRWWTRDAGLQAKYTLPFTDKADLESIEVIIAVGLGSASPRELFKSHCNAGLLSMLPLAAPTNTVSGEPAANLAQDADTWWRLLGEAGASEVETTNDVALALAGDRKALGAIPGGTRGHRSLNEDLVRLLWPSLWGHTLKDVWCVDQALGLPGFTFEAGLWAQQWLHPEGPLPPLRIGDQPYGLLPVTRLNDNAWRAAAGDPAVERNWLAPWLPKARERWANSARSHSGTIAGADTDRFVQMLGRTPSASDYGYRTFLPLQVMHLLSGALLADVNPADTRPEWVREQTEHVSNVLAFPVHPLRRYMTSGWRQDLILPLVEPPPPTGPLAGLEPGWTHIVSANEGSLFFHRSSPSASDRSYATARLSGAGHYQSVITKRAFQREFTHITGTAGGGVFFYNATRRKRFTDVLNSTGDRFERYTSEVDFPGGWTHITSAGQTGLFFYNPSNGTGATGLLRSSESFRLVDAQIERFSGNWSHITGATSGGLLFYNSDTGEAATAWLTNQGQYGGGAGIGNLAPGWTHIVSANVNGLLLYNVSTGEAQTATLSSTGGYQFVAAEARLAPGWTHITGAANGGLLFYNSDTGEAATARLDALGYFQLDEGSMFFAQLDRILELDEADGVAQLFMRQSDYCDPLLQTDSLLMRMILNSIALLQAEIGRMAETGDRNGQPLVENLEQDGYCTNLQRLCEIAAEVRLHDYGTICNLLGLRIDPCKELPIVHLHQNLYWALYRWRDRYLTAVNQAHNGETNAGAQLLADIERALRAVLDTAAIRIDPWLTGMAWRRLTKLRSEGATDGLGLYAWVDKPYRGSPGPTEGGTLLAPSHAQLLTSLILRDKQINDFQADRWQIQLDSRKIRLANHLADEVRAGAHIQEVLGRAVEGVVGNNDQIKQLRKVFQIRKEHAGHRVCDGQKALSKEGKTVLDALNLSETQQTALEELRQVADTYGDLLVANAVHALVSGQPEKAGETMDAAAGLELPPELDLLRTPHEGFSVNTTVWLALPDAPQPDADDLDASPALLADAAVVTFLEQSAPLAQWTWKFIGTADEGGEVVEVVVKLADMGLRVADTLAYSEDALNQLAARHLPGGFVVDWDGAGQPSAALAYRRLRRLAALLAGHAADGHQVPDEDTQRIALWQDHDVELRTRFDRLLATAKELYVALDPDAGDPAALRRAWRWGIAPAPLDDSLAPPEHRLSDEEQLEQQLKQAHTVLGDRLSRIKSLINDEGLTDNKTPIHQITQALSELSGAAMPIFGRGSLAMLEDFGGLDLAPNLDLEWLETMAAVRPALARLEAHQLGSEARWHAWCNTPDPWALIQPEENASIKQATHVAVCYSPHPTLGRGEGEQDGDAVLAVAVLDSWNETTPAKRHIVEAAFGFNAPSSRAPQAILLAVPPDEARPLDTEMLAHIVLEARETAHARMAMPDDLADYAVLFPFAMLPAQQPTGVDMRPVDPFARR
jgi:hypothetical protein